ncbi:DUF1801 domain-containing protein [Alteromonas ponticola]|uniref:DUF1801 domain-containing protein n=1 Tax=Alteromonas aquimaris TaxID=2998417 RepID=A0ABT3PB43_9ALTE|nr:DUF1801 domain-containing protein [Alteromonas aquimaris]MCW8109785.1 DUF1801 domain-containing protein [Alteromonas aquimaris]
MGIENYIATAEPTRAARLTAIIHTIQTLYPDAAVTMDYKMPTFKREQGWVAVANQKNYISFYTCAAEHIAKFKHLYPQIKSGKGCINFKDSDEIDLLALEVVIHSALN